MCWWTNFKISIAPSRTSSACSGHKARYASSATMISRYTVFDTRILRVYENGQFVTGQQTSTRSMNVDGVRQPWYEWPMLSSRETLGVHHLDPWPSGLGTVQAKSWLDNIGARRTKVPPLPPRLFRSSRRACLLVRSLS